MAASRVTERTRYPGIYRLHRRGCAGTDGARCRCPRSYQATVFDSRAKKLIRKHFTDLGTARSWRDVQGPGPQFLARVVIVLYGEKRVRGDVHMPCDDRRLERCHRRR